MTVINTNIAASVTANAMKSNARVMENTMERLATGTRVNSASDDAAGLAIGSKMTSQIRGLEQAARNANDAVSLLQTADGAAIEISDMLQRMRELAVQAANGTNDTTDIANLNKEFAALATEIDRVTDDTEFNGLKVLQGNLTSASGTADQLEFVVGKDAADKLTVSFSDFNLANGASSVTEVLGSEAFTRAGAGATSALGYDLAGTIYVTDGSETITVDLADVKASNNNTTITAANATVEQVALALNDKATANTAFKLTVEANGTAGFKFIEKAGQGFQLNGSTSVKYTGLNSSAATDTSTLTVEGATAATAAGVMGTNLSAFSSTASSSVDDSATIGYLDTAIKGVAQARADFGASINTLEHTIDNLNVAVQNTSSARSAIMDADYATETTELARTQILAQAATAMLSQANQQQQSVLALLK